MHKLLSLLVDGKYDEAMTLGIVMDTMRGGDSSFPVTKDDLLKILETLAAVRSENESLRAANRDLAGVAWKADVHGRWVFMVEEYDYRAWAKATGVHGKGTGVISITPDGEEGVSDG